LTQQGVGVVVVSHDIDEFLSHAHDVLILAHGRSLWSGRATELIHEPSILQSAGLQVPQVISWQQREGISEDDYTLDPEKAAENILVWRAVKGEC